MVATTMTTEARIMKFPRAAATMLLAAVLAGCGENDPEAGRQRFHLPPEEFEADAATGRRLFLAHCVECHGRRAQGTDRGPPLVDPVYRRSHHADLTIHFAVRDGVREHHWDFGDMPPQPQISPEEAGHIIAYIRGLQRQAGIR